MNITNCVSQFHIWRMQVIHVKSFLANGERKGTLVMLPYSKHEFNVFRKTIAILADSQHSEEWKQTLREHEEKKDRVIEKYKTKCEQKRVRTLTVIIKNIPLNSLPNHQFSLLHRGPRWVSNKRDLKIPRRRRQRELQKSNRFDKQNKNFARASRFFVHFFASTAQLRPETS